MSDAQTIIDGSQPSGVGRVGIYSVALGFRLLVPSTQEEGDYGTTLTFSLYFL